MNTLVIVGALIVIIGYGLQSYSPSISLNLKIIGLITLIVCLLVSIFSV